MNFPTSKVRRVYWFLILHLVLVGLCAFGVITTGRQAIGGIYIIFAIVSPGVFAFGEGGRKALGGLYRRSLPGQHSWMVWLATLLPAVLLLSAMALYTVTIRPKEVTFEIAVAPHFIGVLIAVWVEEVAWRGYALPKLLEFLTAFRASLVLAVFWSFWHLPNFFMEGYSSAGPIGWFALLPAYFSFTFFATWLGVKSRYNILLPTLAHFFMNWSVTWFQPSWMEYVGTIGSGVLLGLFMIRRFRGLAVEPEIAGSDPAEIGQK